MGPVIQKWAGSIRVALVVAAATAPWALIIAGVFA